MQQNANLAEITNNLAMEATQTSPIEFINGQVLEAIARLKSTGDQLFEKTRKIDEKLDQVEKQFQQYMHQSSQKIYIEIERSRTLSTNSLNEIRQIWESKLNEKAEICTRESQQIIVDGQRSICEAIGTLKRDSEKALHSYLDRLEAQLTEAQEQHKSMITDFKIQISNDFETFVRESHLELNSAKEGAKEVFDHKLETMSRSLSEFERELSSNKLLFNEFIDQARSSLQTMSGQFQSQNELLANQATEKISGVENSTKFKLQMLDTEFDNRWLSMVNTHNENLKSFRDSLKEAVVAKVAQHAKKRLDSILNESQSVLDSITNSQEACQVEILSLSQKNQNKYAQIEDTIKILQNELNDEKKKSRLWILFVTLFLSSIFISHYFIW